MKRVLFVDDEPRVLRGIERMLFAKRGQWEVRYVTSGASALAEMEAWPVDVVVSDMRMPEMDGAELLTRVKNAHPGAVRIILSGHAEAAAAVRALPVAHRFMSKPCDANIVTETVEDAIELNELLASDDIRSIVGQMEKLPSTPHLYLNLTKVLGDPNGSIEQIVSLVEQDAAMAGKILHLVNTAFFGLPQKTTDIRNAVSLLGTNMLRNLTLTAELFESFRLDSRITPLFSIDDFQRHCSRVARVASRLAPKAPWAAEAFTAGLLHDSGKLVLAARMPTEFVEIRERAAREARPIPSVEQEVLGLTHAEIGAYLLGLWGLPHPVVESVAYHHSPERIHKRSFEVAQAVYVANRLVRETETESGEDGVIRDDLVFGNEHNAARIDEWRADIAEWCVNPS